MDLKNITGLEKPLQKLVEVIAEGIGETTNAVFKFDAKKIKRIGEAEAESEKIKIIEKAKGSSEALEILGRAGKRFTLEQYDKQINLENIIVGTKEILEGAEVSDESVDKDWASRFMTIAQDVSREDMQNLLSRILAEEIKQPNTFSLRTLDFVKNLNKKDILLFKKIAIISNQHSAVFITKSNVNEGFFEITYSEIMQMIEIGLVQASLTTVLKLGNFNINDHCPIELKNMLCFFKFTENQKDVRLPVLQLTTIGKEIASVIEIKDCDKSIIQRYIEELKKYLESKKLEFVKSINL